MSFARMIIAGALLTLAAHVAAQVYPSRAVKMIIPFPAGGPTDILGRLIGQKLTEAWGQSVVIDNRPGGGGLIGGQIAAKSLPDGYTIRGVYQIRACEVEQGGARGEYSR